MDAVIDNSQNILKTSTYRSTYSGLLLNYTSFTSRFYKIGLMKCLIDRAYKIHNTWPDFHGDVCKSKDVLKRNSYPPFILDKIIKAYIDKIHCNNNKVPSEVYIGETCRHFITRVDEHIEKDKQYHVFRHLHSKKECFSSFNLNCFSILDSATTKYQTKLKQGMYIDWEKTNLNKQKPICLLHYQSNQFLWVFLSFFSFLIW